MAGEFTDLAQHTGTLIALIGTEFALLVGVLVGMWKIGTKLLLTFKDDVLHLIEEIDSKVEEIIKGKVEYALKREVDPKLGELEKRQYELRTNILPTFQKKEDMDTWARIMTQGFSDVKDRIDAVSRRLDTKDRQNT